MRAFWPLPTAISRHRRVSRTTSTFCDSVIYQTTSQRALHLPRAVPWTTVMPRLTNGTGRTTRGTLHDFFPRLASTASTKPPDSVPKADSDRHDLSRFLEAQDRGHVYQRAIRELQQGEKQSHWMWFVFPQVEGLAYSSMSQHYALKSWDEAIAYLRHPVLGERLRRASKIVLDSKEKDAEVLMGGEVDAQKLRSCMTLFALVARRLRKGEDGGSSEEVFGRVLEKYFDGELDNRTVDIVKDRWRNPVG